MANMITGLRVICSIVLLFCPTLSISFYIVYIAAGMTDMIDGMVARKTNSVSVFGSKFDTAADFIFVVVCLIKLIPVLHVEGWTYIWIAVIAAIKVFNMILGYIKQKTFVAVHSVMNKVTGALLFALPFTLRVLELRYSVFGVCFVASLAAIQEGYLIGTWKVDSSQHCDMTHYTEK